MRVGIPKETRLGEKRVACTPESIDRLTKLGLKAVLEEGAGLSAGFMDAQYAEKGAEIRGAKDALCAEIILKVHPPSETEAKAMKSGALLVSFLEPQHRDGLNRLASGRVNAAALELVPRTSRAQSMDALSSQAGLAGYRATIEAAARYPRFFPMMMTSAGSAKPARVIVLGVGVAGLQAISTAKRLGATVQAYDIRPETREQVKSVGAKFIDLEDATKERQRVLLNDKLEQADILITTASVPGRKAPLLVSASTLRRMRPGSVIVDMSAAQGGNCELTVPNEIVVREGITIVGITNYPALVPGDASQFLSRNLISLLTLFWSGSSIKFDLTDDIVSASLAVYDGEVRFRGY